MAWWAWVLCVLGALLGLGFLALLLFRVRYRLEWRGEWGGLESSSKGAIELRYGFVGFTKTWNPLEDNDWTFPNPFDLDDDDEEEKALKKEQRNERQAAEAADGNGADSAGTFVSNPAPETPAREREEPYFVTSGASSPGKSNDRALNADIPPKNPQPKPKTKSRAAPGKDPNRKRRALFRFLTDGDVWKFVGRYGVRCVRLVFWLLNGRGEAALGHPDPVRLGRLAGKWYAVRPFLPLGDTAVHFRFQDRHPTLWLRVEGGFSLLRVLGFALRLLLSFPLIRFGLGAWKGWRQHRLSSWRAWIYRRLQTRPPAAPRPGRG